MSDRAVSHWHNQTYHITTFGCQMNVRDSETAAGVMEEMGYRPAATMEQADVILFNTCCIRDLAEQKAYAAIGRAHLVKEEKPNTIIGVFGCMMQQPGKLEELKKRMPYVDFAFGTHNLHRLPEYLQGVMESPLDGDACQEFSLPAVYSAPPLAYINIIHGCNNFCSYCIVPYVRGREKSKPQTLILQEAEMLLEKGYREITLLGQNVNSYGLDQGKHAFAELLQALNALGVPRIRFMTSHPKDLTADVIDAMAQCEHVCAQIHLPVQSGSNRILKLMNRKYTREQYLQRVYDLRSAMPDVGISTDLIVGFPSETEEDFLETVELCKEVRYDAAFTFNFSPRKGTKAYDLPGRLPKDVQRDRITRLIQTVNDISKQVHKAMVGSTQMVLIEGESAKNPEHHCGKTERGRTVNFPKGKGRVGDIVPVKILKNNANTLFGEEIGQQER